MTGGAHEPTLGAILAGGLSRRMGGGDKSLALLAGRPMLHHVRDRLAPQCAALILNANGHPDRFKGSGLPVVRDTIADWPGPLAGILAALDWASVNRPDLGWVATAAADTPLLPSDFVARLHSARAVSGVTLACASSGGGRHPVEGLWPVSIRAELRAALEAGERRVGMWMAGQGLATAEWSTEPFDPFFNVNAPEDLAEAERILRTGTSAAPSARKPATGRA